MPTRIDLLPDGIESHFMNLALRYVVEIKSWSKIKPCFDGGWCLGALIFCNTFSFHFVTPFHCFDGGQVGRTDILNTFSELV